MKVLITGGTGLLGHYLIPALHDRGDTVRALTLPGEDTAWLHERNIATYPGDVRQPDSLNVAMRGVDTVFHLAGMMGVWRPFQDYYDVNVTGTENVGKAVLAAGVSRLIHISSWTVYGMNLGRPAREDFSLAPFPEPYALTKTAGDQVIQRMIEHDGLPAVIIRPGTFFGPGDRLHFARMADRLHSGQGLIVGNGRNALPFVYVTDVIQGILRAADEAAAVGQAFNITNDEPLTQEAFLRAIADEIGAKAPRLRVPYHALYAAAFAAERVAELIHSRQPVVTRLGVKLFGTDNRHSIGKARRALGYIPQMPIREGIRLAATWYQQQSPTRAHSPTGTGVG